MESDDMDEEKLRTNRRDILLTMGGVGTGGIAGGISGIGFYRSYIWGRDAFPGVSDTIEAFQDPPGQRPQHQLQTPLVDDQTTVVTELPATYQNPIINSDSDINHQAEELSTEDISLRFAIVSDGHWGSNDSREDDERFPDSEPTDLTYEEAHEEAKLLLNEINNEREIDFLVLLGDNVHDNRTRHSELIEKFVDRLDFTGGTEGGDTFFGAFGNHDWSYDDEWEADYGHPKNYSFTKGDYGFTIAGTGRPNGGSASANWEFIEQELDKLEENVKSVFCFQHIQPSEYLQSGMDMPGVRWQYARDIVGGVFVGHGHAENDLFVTSEGAPVFNCPPLGNNKVYSPRGLRIVDIID